MIRAPKLLFHQLDTDVPISTAQNALPNAIANVVLAAKTAIVQPASRKVVDSSLLACKATRLLMQCNLQLRNLLSEQAITEQRMLKPRDFDVLLF